MSLPIPWCWTSCPAGLLISIESRTQKGNELIKFHGLFVVEGQERVILFPSPPLSFRSASHDARLVSQADAVASSWSSGSVHQLE